MDLRSIPQSFKILKELKKIFQRSLKDLFHNLVEIFARIPLEFDEDPKGILLKISTTSLHYELGSFNVLK